MYNRLHIYNILIIKILIFNYLYREKLCIKEYFNDDLADTPEA